MQYRYTTINGAGYSYISDAAPELLGSHAAPALQPSRQPHPSKMSMQDAAPELVGLHVAPALQPSRQPYPSKMSMHLPIDSSHQNCPCTIPPMSSRVQRPYQCPPYLTSCGHLRSHDRCPDHPLCTYHRRGFACPCPCCWNDPLTLFEILGGRTTKKNETGRGSLSEIDHLHHTPLQISPFP